MQLALSHYLLWSLHMFLTAFTTLSVLLLTSIDHLRLYAVFDSTSSIIDEALSINPSAYVFVFGEFNIDDTDWLTYSGGTGRPGELCYNFSISNDLTQMVNFLTWVPDCDFHSPALLDLFLSFDASICSTMAFCPLVNSDNVLSQFALTSHQTQRGIPHCII